MKNKNKITVLIVCIVLCLAITGGTYAWYLREDAKRAQTESAQVMAPYNLYLLNPNAADTLQFAVGNLHPGEVKRTVICVSNKRPDNYTGDESIMTGMVKDSEFGYDLMLVHTENLAVDYNVYPLIRNDIQAGTALPDDAIIMEDDTKDRYYWMKAGNPLPGSDSITSEMRNKVGTDADGIVNAGTYWLSDDDGMMLSYKAGEGSYEYDYYLIEVTWQNIDNFDAYKKETDLVYVVVNAKQPRPVEQAGS